ncbi:hypothetical protein HID58_089119 [Brassica napus]|uniref:Uncharacterized protein n=1 Tax=Brassica napus TaxID=3708 RepID=A0ABQ7XY59_BRANA|nr:hypothetical protein HID58_089119 [Brassica napus]
MNAKTIKRNHKVTKIKPRNTWANQTAKPFLGHKPIILNPKAPLHSLKVRERDACQDPHCEGPRITRPPRVDRTTIREARVERSKPHLFTEKARRNSTLEPKPVEAIDLETSIYALRNIKRLRSNQNQQGYSERESIGQRKSKNVDRELVPDQIGEEAGERTVLSEPPLSRRRSPAKSGAIRATVSRKRKLATAV